jgi:hypothetical protein
MARPIVTVPPVTILMEMAGYGSLTEWLARPAILVAGVCRNQWKVLVNHFSSHFRTGRTKITRRSSMDRALWFLCRSFVSQRDPTAGEVAGSTLAGAPEPI